MLLIDSLLAAPGNALFAVFSELAQKAEDELLDERPVTEALRQAYALLETGQITEEQFDERESRLVAHLEKIRAIKKLRGA